jgi:lysophospholipase L1-like esterase
MRPGKLALLVLATLLVHAHRSVADPARWESAIAAYEAADQDDPPRPGGIVFVGSSSIRLWTTLAGDFPDHNVINRGFGGSQLADSIAFLDRIVIPYRPSMIVLYAGANDINAGKPPQQVLADFRTLVEEVRERLPTVEIAFISIAGNPARWSQVDRVREANRLVAQFAQQTPGVRFIDVFTPMMGPDGLPKPDIFVDDRLHMNEKGYAIWREVVGAHLPRP